MFSSCWNLQISMDFEAIRERQKTARLQQQAALAMAINKPDLIPPEAKRRKLENGGASSSSSSLIHRKPEERPDFIGSPEEMIAKLEETSNIKHALKVFEKIHECVEYEEIPTLKFGQLAHMLSIVISKPLTADLMRGKGFTEQLVIKQKVKPTSLKIEDKLEPEAAVQAIDIMSLAAPLNLGLMQNMKAKSLPDLIRALYVNVKIKLFSVNGHARFTYEASQNDRSCAMALRQQVLKDGGTKSITPKCICMLLSSIATICNRKFNANLEDLHDKYILPREILRALYVEALPGIKNLEFVHCCDIVYGISIFNDLHTERDAKLASIHAHHRAESQMNRREPEEEKIFQLVGEKCREQIASMPLKNIVELLTVYGNFGYKDQKLFEAACPILLKNVKRLGQIDFQAVMKAYIKFNFPFKEESVGFRQVAIMTKGDFNRPSEKPKGERFTYDRPDTIDLYSIKQELHDQEEGRAKREDADNLQRVTGKTYIDSRKTYARKKI